MINYNFSFITLHISTLLSIVLFIYLVFTKNKKQIHYAFLFSMFCIVIWSLTHLIEVYYRSINGNSPFIFVKIYFFGVCFSSVSLYYLGIVYAKTKIKFFKKYIYFLLLPLISYVILLTNGSHLLFFVRYSNINIEVIKGKYFLIHNIISYAFTGLGLYYLFRFSIKNSGFFSKQSLLILTGSSIPVIVNIFNTFKIIKLPMYSTPIAFSLCIILIMLAINKFNILNMTPIALQSIVDQMSDSFLVLNDRNIIIDYNKTFIDTFNVLFTIKRNENIEEILKKDSDGVLNINYLISIINQVRDQKDTFSYETLIEYKTFRKYFMIEVTPIWNKAVFIGTLIMLKDITQNKLNMEKIKNSDRILMEQERLASLGQMIGGIAHNLKTPIMSIAGVMEALKELITEYKESIYIEDVTKEDHKEIAVEMEKWVNKVLPHCAYMTDIINTVKDQAVQFSGERGLGFTIKELVNRIDTLMKHELTKSHCELVKNIKLNINRTIKGEVNNLVQVIDNLIINAIQSYEGNGGQIELNISEKDDKIEFIVKDYGKGIPEKIKDRLFKEMVTTKGKEGTGLGLYMSNSIIKGRFGGKISVISEEGTGTTFYISI